MARVWSPSTVYSNNTKQDTFMAETTTQNPVDIVKNAVKALQDQKAVLEEQLAGIEKQLQDIADVAAVTTTKAKPGRKPGRRPGIKAGGRPATPVPEEDTKALLAAMNKIGGKMRSSDAYKKAGLDKPQGKKAMAELKADKKVTMNGPWVSVA